MEIRMEMKMGMEIREKGKARELSFGFLFNKKLAEIPLFYVCGGSMSHIH